MIFKGKLGNYKVISTEDGSVTIWSEAFDENCHSTAGAQDETKFNFVEANNLLKFAEQKSRISILEIGYGTGLGYQTIAHTLEENSLGNIKLQFTSLELDDELVKWSQAQSYPLLNCFPNISLLERNEMSFKAHHHGNNLEILLGDATQTIKKIDTKFDFILQDAFSPKKNPTLWTQDWFNELYRVTRPGGILTTYSSAGSVRKALKSAQWQVQSIPGFANKKEATRAIK